MKKALPIAFAAMLAACNTIAGPPTLSEVVRGPARVCLERAAFALPSGGTIVQAEQGQGGTHLIGSIGPHAFEITESARFAALPADALIAFQGAAFTVRQVGDLPGSYAVYRGTGEAQETQPAVRIEHYFGTDSVTIEDFFAGYDPAGAVQRSCDRRF